MKIGDILKGGDMEFIIKVKENKGKVILEFENIDIEKALKVLSIFKYKVENENGYYLVKLKCLKDTLKIYENENKNVIFEFEKLSVENVIIILSMFKGEIKYCDNEKCYILKIKV